MTLFYWDECAAEDISRAYHEWQPLDVFVFDEAEVWLAAQDVPDWTIEGG